MHALAGQTYSRSYGSKFKKRGALLCPGPCGISMLRRWASEDAQLVVRDLKNSMKLSYGCLFPTQVLAMRLPARSFLVTRPMPCISYLSSAVGTRKLSWQQTRRSVPSMNFWSADYLVSTSWMLPGGTPLLLRETLQKTFGRRCGQSRVKASLF